MKRRLSWIQWLVFALVMALALYNYRVMLSFTAAMFLSPIEDMSHGWVVPLVSVVILWQRRDALRRAAAVPSWRGLAWVVLCLVLAWFGGRGGQSRLEQVSLIGLIWALPFALWGQGVERLLRFPALYLCFTIPVSSFLDFFTIKLRMLSTFMATGLLNGIGITVVRSGTALFSRVPGAEFNVDVADPCSGIRSLFAMMALTAAYAFYTQRGFWRQWLLFACALPIAVIGNMVRVMSICLVAAWFGQEIATGYYHDYSGYMVFLVGVLLMFQAGEWIKRWRRPGGAQPEIDEAKGSVAESSEPPKGALGWRGLVMAGLILLLCWGVFTARMALPPPEYREITFLAEQMPRQVAGMPANVPWFCHNPQCLRVTEDTFEASSDADAADAVPCPTCGAAMHRTSLGEHTDLPRDTVILKANYHALDGLSYATSVVIGGRHRHSIHRAELCLPAQGFTMLRAQRLSLMLADKKPLVVRKIEAQRAGGQTNTLIYWFVSEKRVCCSHSERILTDVWDRSVHNRINRWVMFAINLSSGLDTPEAIERLEAFVSEFIRHMDTTKS